MLNEMKFDLSECIREYGPKKITQKDEDIANAVFDFLQSKYNIIIVGVPVFRVLNNGSVSEDDSATTKQLKTRKLNMDLIVGMDLVESLLNDVVEEIGANKVLYLAKFSFQIIPTIDRDGVKKNVYALRYAS